ncbi:hypothetical protein [Massilibacterium senegalense]|uniref:hypothetical protein n=1 Tax=Massilibacterium senegalense TaxID=1632858 RepID=UPI00164D2704|nr:hypothetical protein [Massilibacterium senegalense]
MWRDNGFSLIEVLLSISLLFSSLLVLLPVLLTIQKERQQITEQMDAYLRLETENIKYFFQDGMEQKEEERCVRLRQTENESICVPHYSKKDSRSLKQS